MTTATTDIETTLDGLAKYHACSEAVAYVKTQKTWQEAWSNCPRGDWMLWIIARVEKPAWGSPEHRKLVGVLCQIVREIAAPHWRKADAENLDAAMKVVEKYAAGGEVSRDELRRARSAASASAYADADAASAYADAAYAAADAAYAASASAYAAADAASADAAYAASAYAASAYAAADARTKARERSADIVRATYPTTPTL